MLFHETEKRVFIPFNEHTQINHLRKRRRQSGQAGKQMQKVQKVAVGWLPFLLRRFVHLSSVRFVGIYRKLGITGF